MSPAIPYLLFLIVFALVILLITINDNRRNAKIK